MRAIHLIWLVTLGITACGDSNGPNGRGFTASIKKHGGSTSGLSGDSTTYDLSCSQSDTLCSHLFIAFYADGKIPGYESPTTIFLQANNVPANNLKIIQGTYPFNDISPFDIWLEIDSGGGFWWTSLSGTLTIEEADGEHFAGHLKAHMDQPGRPDWGLPPLDVNLTFDVPAH